MPKLNILMMTVAAAQIANVANADILECLRSKIDVTPIEFDQRVIDNRAVNVEVVNHMEIALGGVWVDFEIHSDQRSAPIYSGSIRPAATIEGLLEPGEKILATDYHFMDERALQFAREATELTIRIEVQNAADWQMKGFIPHPRMGSWMKETTEEQCISR